MSSDLTECRRWMADGEAYFLASLRLNSDQDVDGPSRLPGWSGRHLLSHLGHNAAALGRLVHWAATGEATPMYASPQARAEEIEAGALMPVARLRAFVEEEQQKLAVALNGLGDAAWRAQVVTAQGRTVPAGVIPWLRAREVWIHACDLPVGGDFTAFPDGFVDALIDDALDRRRTAQDIDVVVRPTDRAVEPDEEPPVPNCVQGPSAALARWLTGRGTPPGLSTPAGTTLPGLSAWL